MTEPLNVTHTIRDTLLQGTSLLRSANIETPQLDVSLVLAHLLHVEKSRLVLMHDEVLPEETFQEFISLMKRRIDGENVAYLLGIKEFWGLNFTVNASVLVPRPDTEILVEAALNWIKPHTEKNLQRNFRVIDICTGSGAIAIALKHECPELIVEASDISKDALNVASVNICNLLGENAITLHQSNLLDNISGTFDLIVSNPPYVPTKIISSLSKEVQREPLLALDGGEDGLDLIRILISAASKKLNPNGKIFLEADSAQMPVIKNLLQENDFVEIEIIKDLAGLDRVISGSK